MIATKYARAAMLVGLRAASMCIGLPSAVALSAPKPKPAPEPEPAQVPSGDASKPKYLVGTDPGYAGSHTFICYDDVDGVGMVQRIGSVPTFPGEVPVKVPPHWLKRSLSRVSSTPAKPRGLGSARKRGIVGVRKRK